MLLPDEILTQRLRLRPLQSNDAPWLFKLRSDAGHMKYIDRSITTDQSEVYAFIKTIQDGIDENRWNYWAIDLQDEDSVVGTICLWNYDKEFTYAEIGFEISQLYQSKGIATEALKAVLQHARSHPKLKRIGAYFHEENQAAAAVLEKLGFKFLRKHVERSWIREQNFPYKIYQLQLH